MSVPQAYNESMDRLEYDAVTKPKEVWMNNRWIRKPGIIAVMVLGCIGIAPSGSWSQDGGNDFYDNITAGATGEAVMPFPTNHLRGDQPKGGHTLFCDGHLEWKPFTEVLMRYTSSWQNMDHYW